MCTRRRFRNGLPLIGPLQRVEEEGQEVRCSVCDGTIDGELLNPDAWCVGRETKWYDYRYRYTVYRIEGKAQGNTRTWTECEECFICDAAVGRR